MSGALAMQGGALAMQGGALAMRGSALAMRGTLAMRGGTLAMRGGALAMHSSALAMHGAALAMHGALTMDLMSMQRCLARPVRGTYQLAEVEAVIVRNFTPAFAGFKLPCDCVEALARCLGEQVCIFQLPIAEPRR